MNWFLCVIPLFQEHSVEEPLSRPPGALFQVGSGSKGDMNEKIPEPISEFCKSLSQNVIVNLEVISTVYEGIQDAG